jgi:hypothetical protein
MGFGNNFEKKVMLHDGQLQIRGGSNPDHDGVLVARVIALQQPQADGKLASMFSRLDLTPGGWGAVLMPDVVSPTAPKELTAPTPPPVFGTGPAVAIGTETYFMPGNGAFPPKSTGTFVTVTWSEQVDIEPGEFVQDPPPTP